MSSFPSSYPLSTLVTQALQGQVISFPTDTVPALAVQPESAGKIFQLKKREPNKPLILMGASFADLRPYLQGTPAEFEQWLEVVNRYLPGALTLVLPASPHIPKALNPLDPSTIGIRIPALPLAQEILAQTKPLATTSANLSGSPPLRKMADIAQQFPEVMTLELENPETIIGSGLPSTVAKWTGTGWQILRQGAIQITDIRHQTSDSE